MAFSSTTPKKVRNFVREDRELRFCFKLEEKTNLNWKNKWSWLLKEYHDLHKRAEEFSKCSPLLASVNKNMIIKEDARTTHPLPVTTNQHYGWICSKPEFVLDKYGPDLPEVPPLSSLYKIPHD